MTPYHKLILFVKVSGLFFFMNNNAGNHSIVPLDGLFTLVNATSVHKTTQWPTQIMTLSYLSLATLFINGILPRFFIWLWPPQKKMSRLADIIKNSSYPLTLEKIWWLNRAKKELLNRSSLFFFPTDTKKLPSLKQLNEEYKIQLRTGFTQNKGLGTFIENLHLITLYQLLTITKAPLSILPFCKQNPYWIYFKNRAKHGASRRHLQEEMLTYLAESTIAWDEHTFSIVHLAKCTDRLPKEWCWKKFLAHFYKIHLMPKPADVLTVLFTLFVLFKENNLGSYVSSLKVIRTFSAQKSSAAINAFVPVIVLYIRPPQEEKEYKTNAQKVINLLLLATKDEWGSGKSPRWNRHLGTSALIFYSQGEGSCKNMGGAGKRKIFEAPDYALYRTAWVDPNDTSLDFSLTT